MGADQEESRGNTSSSAGEGSVGTGTGPRDRAVCGQGPAGGKVVTRNTWGGKEKSQRHGRKQAKADKGQETGRDAVLSLSVPRGWFLWPVHHPLHTLPPPFQLYQESGGMSQRKNGTRS